MSSLLPVNSTALERALEQTGRLDHLSPEVIRSLWNPATCPEDLLPWLAWALSVDFWEDTWPLERQRAVIAGSIAWHRKKGTPWALKEALAAMGFPVMELIESADYQRQWVAAGGLILDGSWVLDAQHSLSVPEGMSRIARATSLSHWAQYAIRINAGTEPWTRAQQQLIQRIANAYAPARSELAALIVGLSYSMGQPIQMAVVRQKVTLRFERCQRVSVLQRRTLDGCWTLGGSYAPRTLNGQWRLSGVLLSGLQPEGGMPWAVGQVRFQNRIRLYLRAAMGLTGAYAAITLGGQWATLDGRWKLDRLTLKGWPLDEGITLDQAGFAKLAVPRLDGTWTLGPKARAPHISARALIRIKQHGQISQEPTQ